MGFKKCYLLFLSASLVYLLQSSYVASNNNINSSNNNNNGPLSNTNNQKPIGTEESLQQSTATTSKTTSTNKPPTEQHEAPRRQQAANDEYLIGVGIADITGPSADINLVSLIRQLATASSIASGSSSSQTLTQGNSGSAQPLSPFIQSASSSTATASSADELLRFQYPSWRDLQDVKLQLKINFNSLLLRTTSLNAMLRWAMPNQIKMQAEFTYANLVVQL